jgi:hypothetical protein
MEPRYAIAKSANNARAPIRTSLTLENLLNNMKIFPDAYLDEPLLNLPKRLRMGGSQVGYLS